MDQSTDGQTHRVIKAARELGRLIAEHEAVKRYEAALADLEKDEPAQRALEQYHRQIESISQKQATGQPIEVEEKQELAASQKAVVNHPRVSALQVAEMDYVDLMRRVDEAMGEARPPLQGPAQGRRG